MAVAALAKAAPVYSHNNITSPGHLQAVVVVHVVYLRGHLRRGTVAHTHFLAVRAVAVAGQNRRIALVFAGIFRAKNIDVGRKIFFNVNKNFLFYKIVLFPLYYNFWVKLNRLRRLAKLSL